MIFIVWHHQKAIPCLFGIRSLARPPLWLIPHSPRALCLPACLPVCAHESLISFELSNARVTFHQPAHSAELCQPLPCLRASHSHSKMDWVLSYLHKDKGGQTQHLRFAFKTWYHHHSFWVLVLMLMKISGVYLQNPMSCWANPIDTSSLIVQWNINGVLLLFFMCIAQQLKPKWHGQTRLMRTRPITRHLSCSPALAFSGVTGQAWLECWPDVQATPHCRNCS